MKLTKQILTEMVKEVIQEQAEEARKKYAVSKSQKELRKILWQQSQDQIHDAAQRKIDGRPQDPRFLEPKKEGLEAPKKQIPLKTLLAKLEDKYGELEAGGRKLKETDLYVVCMSWGGNHAGTGVQTASNMETIRKLAQKALDHSGMDYSAFHMDVYDRAGKKFKVIIDGVSLK